MKYVFHRCKKALWLIILTLYTLSVIIFSQNWHLSSGALNDLHVDPLRLDFNSLEKLLIGVTTPIKTVVTNV